MYSQKSAYVVLILIVVAVATLAFVSYKTGYKKSKSDLGSLLMTMRMDSSSATAGLYEELPNNIRKTVQFYTDASFTSNKEIKLFAEVKYITVGNEIINVEHGEIWKFLKRTTIFQRQFKEDKTDEKPNSDKKKKNIPNSQFALK